MTPDQITGELYLPLGFQFEAQAWMMDGYKLLKSNPDASRDYLSR